MGKRSGPRCRDGKNDEEEMRSPDQANDKSQGEGFGGAADRGVLLKKSRIEEEPANFNGARWIRRMKGEKGGGGLIVIRDRPVAKGKPSVW